MSGSEPASSTEETPRPAPAQAVSPAGSPAGDEQPTPVSVPRLLVAASEIAWRTLVCIAAGALFVYAFTRVGFVAFPVLIALLFSTLFAPPARWLQRRGFPAALATTLVMVAGIAAIVGMVAFVAQGVAHEADDLADQISSGADELGRRLADLPLGLDEREIQRQIDSIDDRIRENSDAIRNGVVSGAAAFGQVLASLAITLVVLFFFVKDGPKMWEWICRLFPRARRPALDDMAGRSWKALTSYVRGVVFVALVDAVGIGLGLWLIGVPLVMPLAVLTFVLAFIPIVGAIAAGAAAVLVALVSQGEVAALLTLGVVIFVQQMESNVLYPWLVGRTVQLHPVVVLLSVAIGGALYGVLGAALAVPTALLMISAATVVNRHGEHGEVPVGPQPVTVETTAPDP